MTALDVALPSGAVRVTTAWEEPAVAPRAVVALALGAGAGMDHPFLVGFAAGLRSEGFATLRFAFPYREAGRRMPGPAPHAVATWAAVAAEISRIASGVPFVAAGKSYGGRMASMAAAEGVSAEVVLRLSEELVEGGTAACAGVAALGIDDDGIVNDVTGLEHGLEAEGGSSGIAAGVGDELLALGKVAHDLRDAVNSVVGHLGVGVLLAVPLLPDVDIAEADVSADIDDGAVLSEHDLRPLGHVMGEDLPTQGPHPPSTLLRGLDDGGRGCQCHQRADGALPIRT